MDHATNFSSGRFECFLGGHISSPLRFIALVCMVVLASVNSLAQSLATSGNASRWSALADAARLAKSELSPASLPDRSQATVAVQQDIDATIRYFNMGTSADNAAAWFRYLKLDELLDAIEADASVAQQGQAAVALHQRLVGLAPGLELRNLVQLRGSVGELIAALRFANSSDAIEQLGKQIDALTTLANEIDEVPSAEDLAVIDATVSILNEAKQAPAALQSIRQLFAQPNGVVSVSESLVQESVNRPVDQTRPVRDCILGTRLVGLASLCGSVNADLQPSFGVALLNVSLQGNFSSNNRGYNGPVQLQTVGYGHVFASRAILLNEQGMSPQPAYVHATLSSEIQSIEHRLRIVRRIAEKKAAEQKPLADRIALGKLRARVAEQFVTETNQSQSLGSGDALAKIRPWIGRLNLVEPSRSWGSTDDSLFIQGLLRSDDQLASPLPAPPISPGYDVAVQLHETLISNALTPLLAGRTIKQSQIEPLLELTGKTPGALTSAGDTSEVESPFEIDFAKFRPVIFEARDGVLKLGVRGTRFKQGARELSRAMEITATYTPATDNSGNVLLLRDGDVNVSFPGRGRLSVSQGAIKTTIQKSFADVFPEVIADQPIIVPQDAPLDVLRGRSYRPNRIAMNDGWLTITVQ